MRALRASWSTVRSRLRFSIIHWVTIANESLLHLGVGDSMYWDCPPSRWGGTTMRRAITLVAGGTVLFAHDVQHRIDVRRGACARDDPAVFDEEHVRVYRDCGSCTLGAKTCIALGLMSQRSCTAKAVSWPRAASGLPVQSTPTTPPGPNHSIRLATPPPFLTELYWWDVERFMAPLDE